MLGVSPDSVKSHQSFKKKFNLPFTLLADPDHSIAESYGVWGEKMMFGRKYMGVLRSTFVIDGEGRIAKIFRSVKPEGHARRSRASTLGVGARDTLGFDDGAARLVRAAPRGNHRPS